MVKTLWTSHILVKFEYEAQDVLKALQSGKSFEQVAQRFSQCSSAKQGGDLGVVEVKRLDEDYVEASLKLEPGDYTKKPIRTRFGYHIIRRNR